jgi:hypothetical protein
MERYCSTGQSPQRTVAPTEEEEEEVVVVVVVVVVEEEEEEEEKLHLMRLCLHFESVVLKYEKPE